MFLKALNWVTFKKNENILQFLDKCKLSPNKQMSIRYREAPKERKGIVPARSNSVESSFAVNAKGEVTLWTEPHRGVALNHGRALTFLPENRKKPLVKGKAQYS